MSAIERRLDELEYRFRYAFEGRLAKLEADVAAMRGEEDAKLPCSTCSGDGAVPIEGGSPLEMMPCPICDTKWSGRADPAPNETGFRRCEFCGCNTNARRRACCERGRDADRKPNEAGAVDIQAPDAETMLFIIAGKKSTFGVSNYDSQEDLSLDLLDLRQEIRAVITAAAAEAYRKGAEEMRERAAKECDRLSGISSNSSMACAYEVARNMIRALKGGG